MHGERKQDGDARRAARSRGEMVTAARMERGIEVEVPRACICRGPHDPHLHRQQSEAMARAVKAAEEQAGWPAVCRRFDPTYT